MFTEPSSGMLMDSHEESCWPKAGTRDDEETLFTETRDREITFDAAALIQALSIDHRTDRLINVVGANIIEEFQRAGSTHFNFVEGGLIEQACILARHQMFVTDRARPILPRPALRLVAVIRFLFIDPEPVRAFPSELFAERNSRGRANDNKLERAADRAATCVPRRGK